MAIIGMNHFTVLARDLEETKSFYVDLLGLVEGERPELGFVWMVRRGAEVVGCCVVCFAISTSRGTLVAKLDDVNVRPGLEGQGIGSAMLASLKDELRRAGATRIDTATHFDNPGARRFYERHGFASLREERLSCLL